ncbi:hypothetical protein CP969_26675 [Streptomyces viridosporus T7A]|uniref:MFS transporter n=1 Tax=Streptomyces viridosporus T7A TaxID=665577 RepID=A0ABX6AL08_STRVD|nr:hypothetical protein [Streptomyces viridosporus]QEU87871.1 hypothetical protein CP969_26675 [Streptomyces viridosporus T7A]
METGAESGGALGTAVLGSLGTARLPRRDAGLRPGRGPRETLGGALAVAQRLPEGAGDALATAAREAFTSGMNAAAVAGAVVLAGAAVLAGTALRGVRVREEACAESTGGADRLSPSGA